MHGQQRQRVCGHLREHTVVQRHPGAGVFNRPFCDDFADHGARWLAGTQKAGCCDIQGNLSGFETALHAVARRHHHHHRRIELLPGAHSRPDRRAFPDAHGQIVLTLNTQLKIFNFIYDKIKLK